MQGFFWYENGEKMDPTIKLIVLETLLICFETLVLRLCNKKEKIDIGEILPYLFCVPVYIIFPVFLYKWNISFCSLLVYTQIAIIFILATVEIPTPEINVSKHRKVGTVPVVFRANMLNVITVTAMCSDTTIITKAICMFLFICLMAVVYMKEKHANRDSNNGFALFLYSFCISALLYVCFEDGLLNLIMKI